MRTVIYIFAAETSILFLFDTDNPVIVSRRLCVLANVNQLTGEIGNNKEDKVEFWCFCVF